MTQAPSNIDKKTVETDFSIPKATEAEQQKLSGLAQKMIDLNKQLAGAKSQAEVSVLTRQIAATDIFIDKLVYALYGLNDDEIATIEKNNL